MYTCIHIYIHVFVNSLACAWVRSGRQLYGSTVPHPVEWAAPNFRWMRMQMGAERYLQGAAGECGCKGGI